MTTALTFLAEEPLLLLFLLFGLGTALGAVRVAGIQVGPAAVLFCAIGLTALATVKDITLTVPAEVGTLGLVLFTYTVGVLSGPSFFAALRSGVRPVLTVIGVLAAAAVAATGVGRLLGLPSPEIAGTFAGALTNTPALAAASERAGGAAGPTVGYSIAYLFGVVGLLVSAAVTLRRRDTDGDGPSPVVNLTVRVERTDRPRIGDVEGWYGTKVACSRVRHGEAGRVLVADDDDSLHEGDLVTVVGPRDVVDRVAKDLGHRSSHTLVADRRHLDYRRITLSRSALAGRTLGELDLFEQFGAMVSRVRRGDVDMIADDDLVLQPGDRLRVIAPTARMKEVSTHLGDSVRGLSDINPLGLAVGLCLGVLLGLVTVPLPGGGFEIGAAAGTLLVGLVFGRLGRIGPVMTGVPVGAAAALSQFGMLAFLAYAGVKAGGSFVPAISSGLGWRIAVLGVVVTGVVAVVLPAALHRLHGLGATRVSGMLAGAQTQPAVLAFANERTSFDTRVALGYALVYPAAMIVKIVLAQLLVG
mgnify:CR=1 FL=1